ncbi:hypothetical protein Aeqsu_0704 [Aequorivita sublithincola DSM 14238]|uniref:DUF4136 domain-containing protein n=1 Tax=Aequorivita sublithincola (strain DSM 14238 / LMG 21431 / ACAM 643 / 9-3) TaxID=746697 RepID=I3YT94_AEQSU|nr:DUF4136 domain-containing protein [Aequorivita sublithincola]AFL80212.1 hypothetical protein Aeqsu_0704 [Aequorivita sublithincola DSM 14238]
MKFLPILILSIFLASCGATVAVDYDKQVDFSKYNSYNYFPTIDSGLNQLDDGRIMQITDSLLQQRGFVKSETPQFYINFYARESISNSRNTIGIGLGGGGGNVGVGVSGGIPIGGKVINQQFSMDFIDVEKDNLVWQAVADGEMKEKSTPKQKEGYYLSMIQKVLSKYPPKK